MSTDATSEALSNLLHEERTFPPSEEFAAQANATAQQYGNRMRQTGSAVFGTLAGVSLADVTR